MHHVIQNLAHPLLISYLWVFFRALDLFMHPTPFISFFLSPYNFNHAF